MRRYDLYKILREELKNGSNDLVTRPSGQSIRERIEKDILREREGEIVALDFSRIGIIDYSCADEVAAKMISRLLAGEYGERYIILTGLNENQKENIEVALERKGLAVIAELRRSEVGGRKQETGGLIGNLNNYLQETLNFISKRGKITANDLSAALNLPANTSGTRLLNLHKKRLVRRVDRIRDGGRVWVYEKL